jgi:predicted ribosome-associated RNA-binding protein Tma20
MIITLDNLDSNKQDKIIIIDSNKISINHNGNCYPFARLLYTDNYTDKTYELKREIEYDDKNNINIYIENKYIGSNGILSKINDNEYIVTYDEGIITVILNYLT